MTATTETAPAPGPGRRRAETPKRRSRLKSFGLVALIATVVLGLLALVLALWLNSSLGKIERVEITVPEAARPVDTGDGTTILLLGADSGTERGGNILADAASGQWPAGKYRSDATMLLHIDEAKDQAYLVSIPRDTFVPVLDETGTDTGNNKINAALSLHGMSGAVATVERLSNLRVDHVAMVDWDGFRAITDALGGVPISVGGEPPTTFNGQEALAYVRERYNLPNGDFDRVKRQQNFLRSASTEVLAGSTIANPIKLKNVLDSITSNLAVDAGWSNGQIRSFALSLRSLRPDDISFMTLPTSGTASDPRAGSIVVLDQTGAAALFDAMRADQMSTWVANNRASLLGGIVN